MDRGRGNSKVIATKENGSVDVDWRKRKWAVDFLIALRDCGIANVAARQAGINPKTAYELKNTSIEFREAWESAIEDADASLEHALFTRGRDGIESLKFDADGQALKDPRTPGEYYIERKFDTTAAIFVLKGRNPGKWRDKPPTTVNIFTQSITEQVAAMGIDAEKVIEAAFGQLEGDMLLLPLPEHSDDADDQS